MVSEMKVEIKACSPEAVVYALSILDDISNKDSDKTTDIKANLSLSIPAMRNSDMKENYAKFVEMRKEMKTKTYRPNECTTGAEAPNTPDNTRDKRYAFEWFMREEDQRYWRQTKDLVERKTQKVTRHSMILTAALWGMTVICFWIQLRKSG